MLESPNHALITRRCGLAFYMPTVGYPPRPADPALPIVPYLEHPREMHRNRTRVMHR